MWIASNVDGMESISIIDPRRNDVRLTSGFPIPTMNWQSGKKQPDANRGWQGAYLTAVLTVRFSVETTVQLRIF
jgi:hypothetical protein